LLLLYRFQDVETDIVDVLEDIVVPETEDCPAKFLKCPRSVLIIGCRGVFRVLKPIQLDDDLMRRTSEIRYILIPSATCQ